MISKNTYGFLIGDFMKENKNLIIIYAIINLIIYPINTIFMPKLYSTLITRVSNPKIIQYKLSSQQNNSSFIQKIINYFQTNQKTIPQLIYFITIIAILVAIVFRFKYFIYTKIFPKYKMWLQDRIYAQTLEQRNTDFKEQNVGKDIMRMEDLLIICKDILNFIITNLLELSIVSTLIIIYLYYLDKKFALYAFLQIVIIIILIYISSKKIEEMSVKRIDTYYKITSNIDNSLTNLSNILINNKTNQEVEKNHDKNKDYKYYAEKGYSILDNLIFLIRIITIVTFILIVYHGYKLTKNKKLSVLNFTTIVIILLNFQNSLYNQATTFSFNIDKIVQLKYNKEYLEDLMQSTNKGKNLINTINKGKIVFKNVHFNYKKSNQPIIKNLNLTIESNEKIALLGKSGSGKSTLVKLLIRFYKLTKGEILIDNTPIQDINIQYLRHKVNYINQNTLLFDEDIYYNIKYGNKTNNTNYQFTSPSPSKQTNQLEEQTNQLEEQTNKKIKEILKKYDLLTIYDNLENGLETYAGPKGSKLSLGMQKVTILMRGLMRDSKIMIFDEPLAGLDAKTREKVIKLIVEETKNKTVLIITHDKEIIPYMDRTVALNEINKLNQSNQTKEEETKT